MSEVQREPADGQEEKKRLFRERIWIEQQKKELEQMRSELEQQKKDFRLEQDMTADRNRIMRRQLEQEKKLFDMKWKILEEELRKLAQEKQVLKDERDAYRKKRQDGQKAMSVRQHCGLFFTGVHNKQTLRKRYKELIKIFHPDNQAGDKATLQEINREYDALKNKFCDK